MRPVVCLIYFSPEILPNKVALFLLTYVANDAHLCSGLKSALCLGSNRLDVEISLYARTLGFCFNLESLSSLAWT